MCKKLVLLTSVTLVLVLAGANPALAGVVWEGPGSQSVEEHLDNGNLDTGSSDLEMPYDDSGTPPSDPQLIGFRFQNVGVPDGAIIQSA